MRYITNDDNYIVTVSFGGDVECDWGYCTEYEGSVPTGYTSLDAWYVGEAEKLHRWKVIDGQLTLDEGAAAPPQCNSWVDRIYPVGSIYMSVNPTDPAELFGGTWERIQDTFLLAAGETYEAGATGGEAEHTLTEAQLPKLSGTVNFRPWGGGSPYAGASGIIANNGEIAETANGFATGGTTDGYRQLKIGFGAGQAHNNMPPFLAVYMWQRVADPVIPDEPDDSGFTVTDDDAGNVTIEAYGTATIQDNGAGGVALAAPGSAAVVDDGAGNVTIT